MTCEDLVEGRLNEHDSIVTVLPHRVNHDNLTTRHQLRYGCFFTPARTDISHVLDYNGTSRGKDEDGNRAHIACSHRAPCLHHALAGAWRSRTSLSLKRCSYCSLALSAVRICSDGYRWAMRSRSFPIWGSGFCSCSLATRSIRRIFRTIRENGGSLPGSSRSRSRCW